MWWLTCNDNTCTSGRCTSFKYSWWWALEPETCRVTLQKQNLHSVASSWCFIWIILKYLSNRPVQAVQWLGHTCGDQMALIRFPAEERKIFFSKWFWGPPSCMLSVFTRTFWTVGQPGHELNQTHPSIVGLNQAWSYTSTPPSYRFSVNGVFIFWIRTRSLICTHS